MIKCRVHLYQTSEYIDKDIYIEITLPIAPIIGCKIYLTQEHENLFKKQITINLDIARKYFWHFGLNDSSKLTGKDFKKFNISQIEYIKEICFYPDKDYISIEVCEDGDLND